VRFQSGKSYLWLFVVFATGFMVLLVASDRFPVAANLAAFTLPLMTGFLFLSEFRSGLVLDSWWRATYPIGTWQYKVGLTVRAILTILFTYFAIEFSRLG